MFHYEPKLNKVRKLKDHLLRQVELLLCFWYFAQKDFSNVLPANFIFKLRLSIFILEEFRLFAFDLLESKIFGKDQQEWASPC